MAQDLIKELFAKYDIDPVTREALLMLSIAACKEDDSLYDGVYREACDE